MRSNRNLIIANLRSFTRDRASMFWTLAFPLVFIVLFGTIFAGGGNLNYKVGWVDDDHTAASTALRATFGGIAAFTLVDATSVDEALASFQRGDVRAVIEVPKGYADAVAAAAAGAPVGASGSTAPSASSVPGGASSVTLTLYTDPSQATTTGVIGGIVGSIIGRVNQGDRPSVVGLQTRPVQAENIGAAAYFVPSILAMALMQLGLFGAIPLVQQREKL